jgi:hypothetical protein
MPQSGVSASSREARRAERERRAAPRDLAREPGRTSVDVAYTGGDGVPGRRTVTIRGRGSERYTPPSHGRSRRPSERAYERAGFRPDKVAMWAVLMGLVLVLAAATSSHAAVLSAVHALHAHALAH